MNLPEARKDVLLKVGIRIGKLRETNTFGNRERPPEGIPYFSDMIDNCPDTVKTE